jgi:hypothetical protein
MGAKNGRFRHTYPSGAIYEGDFVSGQRHGEGTYTTADGDKCTIPPLTYPLS